MVVASYLVHYDTFFRQLLFYFYFYFITKSDKMRKVFTAKCDSIYTKCNSYFKIRRFHYKMRQVLQNATFITKYEVFCNKRGIL